MRLKVAAHVHSEWSYDGSWKLSEIARAFGRRGYDAVLMSEHDAGFDPARWHDYRLACAAASSASVLLVPGIEYGDKDNVVHIPVWGEVPFLGSGLITTELLRRASDVGGFAVFAHPWRRNAWRRLEPDWLPALSAVEIWNRKYDGIAPSRAAIELARSAGLRQFVSLDFHTRRQFFPLAMLLDSHAAATCGSIFSALADGAYVPAFMSRHALALTGGVAERALQALELARAQTMRFVRRR
jgi:predicted metal-dependent phosphoesterase TrpH